MEEYTFLPRVWEALNPYRNAMLEAEQAIWKHPETGFKEWFAHSYLKASFENMGYTLTEAGDIPGFYTDVDTGRPGPTVLLMGELDSVLCANHPDANPETGAVHACGHNAQAASLVGIAGAFRDPELLSRLSGKIRIMAVPAEELLEIEYRESLRAKGVIHYLGGKVEFMYRGYMDGVDVAFMVHTAGGKGIGLVRGSNGCLAKTITYKGKASHAGAAPGQGINALYAATLGIQAVNALRETFPDDQHIRFHPIMTRGGAAVNVIPDTAVLESYVRGASLKAMVTHNRRINRALAASAAALGAQVHLKDIPGYMPVQPDPNLHALVHKVAAALVGEELVNDAPTWDTGSTDMGDVACVIPAVHPYNGGAEGGGHGADYRIVDPELAVVRAAAFQVSVACALLENGGAAAQYIKQNARLQFSSMAEYFAAVDGLFMDTDAVEYGGDDTVTLRYTK